MDERIYVVRICDKLYEMKNIRGLCLLLELTFSDFRQNLTDEEFELIHRAILSINNSFDCVLNELFQLSDELLEIKRSHD